ncbi:UDP-N-acetylmuramoyl-tripeptide--D-alanyl-D-alanine ligase [Bacillus sp. FJAT-27916]|uniref:UDP-N-acetylmuramoyl-tripeptide--D-alanyl-D- alanine ligase n=1 Tax=Bacillus sp. FJAT-27916 TaxID=1679169 RepID=UPI000670AB18|nr:UDP-N-acetylmuramoyl-tripeptide--D-alanyl-D-alanine ligase [Bacillus sp. FJAT-27916]KMY46004.1 UDP-N-acetylmuramoyl-tripeptide--D-alanyl-D-alanine ligase [Bacillus sp. FJAT-27916]
MIKRTLAEIAAMVDGQIHDSMKEVVVAGVTTDTRKITNANLFVPLQGEKSNGHDHVQQAFEQGASASFWEHSQPNPPKGAALVFVDDSLKALQQLAKAYLNELDTKVIGITGSNGKTTTKDMTASILGTKYRVHKTSGNFNNHIGLPLTVLSAPEDTEMLILEMGMSSRGEISLLSKIGQPDAAIITNIGESHLLDLGSREGIADAKMEIVEGLKPDGVLIYNGDEPLLINRVTDLEIRKISFGRSLTNDYYPLKIESGQDDMKFTIEKEGQHEFLLPVLGTHNVLNSMAAIAVGREMGVSFDEIAKGLSELKLTNMRMEVTFGAKGEKIINDAYNASPTSMKAAIELVKAMTDATKKILVLGDMLELGPEEAAYHYKMGELITEEIDYVLAYGELSANLAEGAKGNLGAERVFHFDDKQALVQKLKELTEPHALVLVKASRGMRLEEVVGAL